MKSKKSKENKKDLEEKQKLVKLNVRGQIIWTTQATFSKFPGYESRLKFNKNDIIDIDPNLFHELLDWLSRPDSIDVSKLVQPRYKSVIDYYQIKELQELTPTVKFWSKHKDLKNEDILFKTNTLKIFVLAKNMGMEDEQDFYDPSDSFYVESVVGFDFPEGCQGEFLSTHYKDYMDISESYNPYEVNVKSNLCYYRCDPPLEKFVLIGTVHFTYHLTMIPTGIKNQMNKEEIEEKKELLDKTERKRRDKRNEE